MSTTTTTTTTTTTNENFTETMSVTIINPTVRAFLLVAYFPIFIFSFAGLFVLYKYLQKESGPSSPFLKTVVKVTSVGAILGKKIISTFSNSNIYTRITSSMVNFCVIGAMVVHRYNKFKRQDTDGFSKHITQYLTVAIGAGVTLMFFVTWDIWNALKITPGECSNSKSTALVHHHHHHHHQHRQINAQSMICKSIREPCSNFMTFMAVSVAITASNLCIFVTNAKLTRLIRHADERANTILQMKRSTNTSRIQATIYLTFFFTLNWLPYGLSRFYVFLEPTFSRFQTLNTCFYALSTVLFVIIPMIYYKMDGGFQRFLKTFVSQVAKT